MNEPLATQDLNADALACAAWIARFLKRRGVDRIFGLQGGHIQPIWDHVARRGIRIIDVRDEGAAVHMAHAHAELTGGFGVAMVTAGPGVTNTVTAMANAYLARVPVLLIGGCPPRPQVNMGPLQDIPHVDILRPVTRTSRTLRVAEPKPSKLDLFNAALAAADGAPTGEAVTPKKKKAPAKKVDDAADDAAAETPVAEAAAEAPAAEVAEAAAPAAE